LIYNVWWLIADNEREFSYNRSAPNGPDRWGEIKPSWASCSRGRMQSPIDLSNARPERSLGFLNYSYRPAQATIVNRGHDIAVSRRRRHHSAAAGQRMHNN